MLECQVTGKPPPEITWFKDGVNIDNSPEYVIMEVTGSCALKIRKASQPEHQGDYVCKAKNRCGEAVTTSRLLVKPVQPPKILRPLADTTEKLNAPCVL
ncbi:unnamed protein product, partial [Dibothriocephalus latus]